MYAQGEEVVIFALLQLAALALKNNLTGTPWKGEPELVTAYDFIGKKLGKATPYGVYDLKKNLGWVNVGIDHDTAEFAVESIRRW